MSAVTAGEMARPTPTFGEATRVWARIGLLSFGGPAGQVALMHRVLVEEKRWVGEGRFLHALNFCMLLPGPEAQQLATYVGWLLHGTRGGLVAGTLFILPGFLLVVGLSALYAVFHQSAWLADIFFGMKAAVLAIVIEAVIRIGRRSLRTPAARLVAVAAFVAIFALHVPFPVIVLGAGIIGIVGTMWSDGLFSPAHADAGERDTVAPPAAGWRHAIGTILIWGGLWAGALLLTSAVFGGDSIFPALAVFFSKMAVVTFGGAYAVLAYVADAAVATYHWLTPGQMLDGLALAETTPGPLILVLTYVGFLAGYGQPGVLPPLAGGLVGAVLVTWVTFVPCFLWILLGAPYVERLYGNRRLAGGLAAITAAVAGVILNLALYLGLHVLFREVGVLEVGPLAPSWPVWASLDPAALLLAGVAALALLRFHLGVVRTLALCCVLGLALRWLWPI